MLYSECCGEIVYDDYDICSECLEHCDTWEDEDDDDFDFDKYCEENPDFNDAINGMYK